MTTMNTNTSKHITDVAPIIAMKALKTAYANSGLSLYMPTANNQTFDEFVSIASLAMVESCQTNNVASYMVSPELWETITKPAYKAINQYITESRRQAAKHLYSIDDIDSNGNELVSDVTVEVTQGKFELVCTLKRNLSPSEWKVLKYIVFGYTTETIQRKMGYSTKASTIRKCENVRKTARHILKAQYGLDVAHSNRTKVRRRKAVRK